MRLVLTSNPRVMLYANQSSWSHMDLFALPYYVNFTPVCNQEWCASTLIKVPYTRLVATHVPIVLLDMIDY